MVLPSEFEPFAVVVNEASCCGCPVIASNRVGAARDLIGPVDPTLIYPCGDVLALVGLLRNLFADRDSLKELGYAARRRMETWSPRENIAETMQAIRQAVAHAKGHVPSLPAESSSRNESSSKGRQRLSQ
jgi:glycosyltransferase involved in cell wall biosynthesis